MRIVSIILTLGAAYMEIWGIHKLRHFRSIEQRLHIPGELVVHMLFHVHDYVNVPFKFNLSSILIASLEAVYS